MSIEKDGFPDEESRRFHETFARFSLGQLTVTEAIEQGLEFEHGTYGAVVQHVDEETFRRIKRIVHPEDGPEV